MCKAISRSICSSLFVLAGIAIVMWAISRGEVTAETQDAKLASPQTVDDDMHHFMEYVFEPNYQRLKGQMAVEPEDKKAWKSIKGDALTLAECANLLLMRAPAEDANAWQGLSVAVRMHGAELYRAAGSREYATAQAAYRNLLKACNSCHTRFAGGEHQLQP